MTGPLEYAIFIIGSLLCVAWGVLKLAIHVLRKK